MSETLEATINECFDKWEEAPSAAKAFGRETFSRYVCSALALKGLYVAPLEPTEAMHDAARDWSIRKYGNAIGIEASLGCWAAMLQASQAKPENKM